MVIPRKSKDFTGSWDSKAKSGIPFSFKIPWRSGQGE
jgi:hypothetical protein